MYMSNKNWMCMNKIDWCLRSISDFSQNTNNKEQSMTTIFYAPYAAHSHPKESVVRAGHTPWGYNSTVVCDYSIEATMLARAWLPLGISCRYMRRDFHATGKFLKDSSSLTIVVNSNVTVKQLAHNYFWKIILSVTTLRDLLCNIINVISGLVSIAVSCWTGHRNTVALKGNHYIHFSIAWKVLTYVEKICDYV